jgi:hypothetical protein
MGKLHFHYFVAELPTVVAKTTREISRKKPWEQKIRSGSFCLLIIPTRSVHLTLTSTLRNLLNTLKITIKMSRHYKKQTPTRQPATPKFPNIEEGVDNCDDESVADYLYHNHVDVSPACSHSRSPFKQTALVGLAQPQLSSFQLVESAEANANAMGLIVLVGNGKRVTDNGRGYCN